MLGRRVRIADGLPDDTVLLGYPEAIEGTELIEPEAIACGIVGTDG
ncbi:hypothetical protein [Natrinema gari]|uniref:Uncharacterized protein n=1 Tax=Natrinema gari JCM 14663 TaxID=1230459 RepID=L9Z5G4_9EURY|nr:hypothetical protein [Natrinema gari]AFO57737.1 hypothetical protein NJ7G_2506 [Natrinema sp. J7-2]ELY80433.1 hypothetical protein C486_08520 [Natrinema gari JCM 14663]